MPAQTNWIYYTTRWIARIICRVYFRIEAHGKENVPSEGPVILAANHASFLDPPLTAVALKRPMHFVARKTLWGKNPLWDKFLYGCNAFPVDQDKPDVASFKVMLRFLQSGEGLVLYPEGSRSWDGSLQEPKTGVARLACRTAVPVVPVYIQGAFQALPRGAKMLKPHKIRVFYGEPVVFKDAEQGQDKNAHYQNVSAEIMQRIGALI